MTVHRFRLYHSTGGSEQYHNWLGQYTLNLNAALGDEVEKEVPTLTQSRDNDLEWYQGDYAFAWDEGKAQIYQSMDLYAESYCNWHRIGYHECSHDEDDPTPCSWDEVRESGTIPSAIPSLS